MIQLLMHLRFVPLVHQTVLVQNLLYIRVTLTLTRGALLGRIVYLFLANALSKVVRPIDWFLPGASMELLNPQNQRLENARECIRVCRCNL